MKVGAVALAAAFIYESNIVKKVEICSTITK